MTEIFISMDIETDGPAAGLNSMLALGAVAYLDSGEELATWYDTLESLPDAVQNSDTMEWWGTQPEAWIEVNKGRQLPEISIPRFVNWCEYLEKSFGAGLVPVAWPAAFDFSFVNYYCWKFMNRNPLGYACCDIRSYANGLARYASYYGLHEQAFWDMVGKVDKSDLKKHVALDDAKGQGRLFMKLRALAVELKAKEKW